MCDSNVLFRVCLQESCSLQVSVSYGSFGVGNLTNLLLQEPLLEHIYPFSACQKTKICLQSYVCWVMKETT